MKDTARYAKIVEWSEEDQCFVGSSPGLIYGGCHGADEKAVFEHLCQVVEEAIALYRQDGKALPPPTSGRDFANKSMRLTTSQRSSPIRMGFALRSQITGKRGGIAMIAGMKLSADGPFT